MISFRIFLFLFFFCNGDETECHDPKCTKKGLRLYNNSKTLDFSAYSNFETIQGLINIQNTNIQTLSFLKSWTTWEIKKSKSLMLNVQDNFEMTRLSAPLLKDIKTNFYSGIIIANIENLHPNFCFTVSELKLFLDNMFTFRNLDAKFCDEVGDIGDKILCRFKSLYDLPNNCDIILGDVKLEKGDEEDITKLMDVWYIFGSLVIQNTELKSLEYLSNLQYIATIDENATAIIISSNPKLKNVQLPALTNIIAKGTPTVIIQDNHPQIFKNKKGKKLPCKLLEWNQLTGNRFELELNFIGEDCGERVVIKSAWNGYTRFFMFLFLSIFNFQLC